MPCVDFHIRTYVVVYAELEYKKIIKNFKGFRNVRKSIETSGDISVLCPITFLSGSEVLAKSHGVNSGPLCKGFRTSCT